MIPDRQFFSQQQEGADQKRTPDEWRQAATNDDTAPLKGNEVAANDGSVAETLDTAFHEKPGWAEGENPSGSNRADYYEARSDGKSDVEEELEALKNRQEK